MQMRLMVEKQAHSTSGTKVDDYGITFQPQLSSCLPVVSIIIWSTYCLCNLAVKYAPSSLATQFSNPLAWTTGLSFASSVELRTVLCNTPAITAGSQEVYNAHLFGGALPLCFRPNDKLELLHQWHCKQTRVLIQAILIEYSWEWR